MKRRYEYITKSEIRFTLAHSFKIHFCVLEYIQTKYEYVPFICVLDSNKYKTRIQSKVYHPYLCSHKRLPVTQSTLKIVLRAHVYRGLKVVQSIYLVFFCLFPPFVTYWTDCAVSELNGFNQRIQHCRNYRLLFYVFIDSIFRDSSPKTEPNVTDGREKQKKMVSSQSINVKETDCTNPLPIRCTAFQQ